MSPLPHETYLATQVYTATPQRLRLMLIEGALRFGRQALACWDDPDLRAQRCSALARCNEIVTELHESIKAGSLSVAERVRDIYRFLLLQLASVSRGNDPNLLREIVEILDLERETWQQLCLKLPEPPQRDEPLGLEATDISSWGMGAIAPPSRIGCLEDGPRADGFSIEA